MAGAVGPDLAGSVSRSPNIPLARFDQRAREVAHHVLEEAAAANAIDEAAGGALQNRRIHRAHFAAAFGVAIVGGGKGREIVLALESARQPAHAVFVEPVRIVMHIGPLERAADLAAQDAVFVGLGLGLEARVKIGRHFLGVQDANGRR